MAEFLINGTPVQQLGFCACDCNKLVNGPRAIFRPGHDQKLVSRLAFEMKVAFGSGDDAAVYRLEQIAKSYSAGLQGKLHTAFTNAKRNTLAAAKIRQKAMFRVAALDDLTTALSPDQVARIGRWTYPIRDNAEGLRERNTKRDGSGEWVALQLPARIEVAA